MNFDRNNYYTNMSEIEKNIVCIKMYLELPITTRKEMSDVNRVSNVYPMLFKKNKAEAMLH